MALFDFSALPGLGTALTTTEIAFLWGKHEQVQFRSVVVDSTSTDVNNSPNTQLRAGLIMAQAAGATPNWKPYNPVASDGTQYAAGILAFALDTIALSGSATARVSVVAVGGPLKGDLLIRNVNGSPTIDQQARAQLGANFIFDDQLLPNPNPWTSCIAKTTGYTVKLADTGTEFTNTGAGGSVTFTLPALNDTASNPQCKGCIYRFTSTAAQAIVVASSGGTDPVIFFNDSAHHTFTSNGNVGITMEVRCNDDGTKWLLTVTGSTQTVVSAS